MQRVRALDRDRGPVKPRKVPTGILVECCLLVAQQADRNLFSEYQRLLVIRPEVDPRVAATQRDICSKFVRFPPTVSISLSDPL